MRSRLFPILFSFCLSIVVAQTLGAQDHQLRIPLPKKSKYTPVQALNRDGVQALKGHHIDKAKRLFYKAYLIDPNDPFTLNNMGYAREKEGELEDAIKYYNQAAMTGARDPIVMALNKDWRGRPIGEVAARNAEKTRKELEKGEDKRATVARLNLRGVSALNRNDRDAARGYFQKAYKMDADNAFALNNMGYLV